MAPALGAVAAAITDGALNATSVLDSLANNADSLAGIAYALLGVAVVGLVAKVGFRTVRKFIGA